MRALDRWKEKQLTKLRHLILKRKILVPSTVSCSLLLLYHNMKDDDEDIYLEESGWESSSIRSSRSFLNNENILSSLLMVMSGLHRVIQIVIENLF